MVHLVCAEPPSFTWKGKWVWLLLGFGAMETSACNYSCDQKMVRFLRV